MFLDQVPVVYRWFTEVVTEEELEDIVDNEFIAPFDVVYCEETEQYYMLDITDEVVLLSNGNQHRTKVQYFHLFNVGDDIRLNDKEYKVIDIMYRETFGDAFYMLSEKETKSVVSILVSVVDANFTDGTPPMQSLIFEDDVE